MRFLVLSLILGVTLPIGAQAPTVDSTALVLAKGKRVFEGRGLCFSCHAADGAGVLGPTTSLIDGKWLHSKGSHAELVALIKKGIPPAESKSGIEMPARGGSRITDAEVDAVARYIVTLVKPTKP